MAGANAPIIGLRAVQTVDFMTARWAPLPSELLDTCARRIVNEVPNVSRVVYDISRQTARDYRVGVAAPRRSGAHAKARWWNGACRI